MDQNNPNNNTDPNYNGVPNNNANPGYNGAPDNTGTNYNGAATNNGTPSYDPNTGNAVDPNYNPNTGNTVDPNYNAAPNNMANPNIPTNQTYNTDPNYNPNQPNTGNQNYAGNQMYGVDPNYNVNQNYNANMKPVPSWQTKWNWGAFAMGPAFAAATRANLAWLVLVPGLSAFWIFYAGMKGEQWALENGDYRDEFEFRKVMDGWNRGGLIMFIMGIIFGIITGIWFVVALSNATTY